MKKCSIIIPKSTGNKPTKVVAFDETGTALKMTAAVDDQEDFYILKLGLPATKEAAVEKRAYNGHGPKGPLTKVPQSFYKDLAWAMSKNGHNGYQAARAIGLKNEIQTSSYLRRKPKKMSLKNRDKIQAYIQRTRMEYETTGSLADHFTPAS